MRRFLLPLLPLLVTACGLLPQAPSKTDTRSLYVWPVEVCPSTPPTGGPARSFVGAIGTTLLGNVVSGLVGIPAAALQAAADADNKGVTFAGTNARFYYQIEKKASSPQKDVAGKPAQPAPDEATLTRPSCYVVVLAQPVKSGKKWCEDAGFKKGVPDSCTHGEGILNKLRVREDLTDQEPRPPGIDGLSIPQLYLEIGFDGSSYEDVQRPKISAMHYPHSVLQPASGEERALTLQLDFTSPITPQDPFKAAQVVLLIPSIKPGSPVDTFSTSNIITGWSVIPSKIPPPSTIPATGKYLPVTIKATFTEVGDPHKFLQAFAKAFGGSTAEYAKTIANEITPLGQQTAQQSKDKATADFLAAYAAAQKSRADVLGACAANPSTLLAKASAESLYTTAQANQRKANNAADLAGVGRKYPDPDIIAGVLACW